MQREISTYNFNMVLEVRGVVKLVASIRVTCSHVEKLVLCENAFAIIISCLDSAYSYTKRSSQAFHDQLKQQH